jgi:hypothetical protein
MTIKDQQELDYFFDYLKHLTRYPSVVGFEESFFRFLRRELEELNVKVSRYQGLLVAEGEAPTSNYISVHVDRHGLMCTGPNEFQYAAFISQNKGDLTGNSTSEQMFWKIADRFAGEKVHAYEPWSGSYMGQGTIRDAYMMEGLNNLFFVINGFEQIPTGVPIAYSDRIVTKGDKLSAQLDNVLMVAMVVYLFSSGYQGTAFFTAQEEAGRSWRFLAEWFQRKGVTTDKLLVLDTSPFGTEKEAFGQHVILRKKDATAPFHLPTVKLIDDAVRSLKVKSLYKDEFMEKRNARREKKGEKPLSIGRTELGRLIEATHGTVTGTTLQIPTVGYHTSNETASLQSVVMTMKLLKKVLKGSF